MRSSKKFSKTPYDRPESELKTPSTSPMVGALKVSSDISTNLPIVDGKDWNWCCRQLGIDKPVTKRDDDYPRVRSLFRASNGLPPIQETPLVVKDPAIDLWADCCKLLGHKFAAKGTPAHSRVMQLFKSRVSELPVVEPTDPKQILWIKCCERLGHVRPKKDTPEYREVLNLYVSESNKLSQENGARKDDFPEDPYELL